MNRHPLPRRRPSPSSSPSSSPASCPSLRPGVFPLALARGLPLLLLAGVAGLLGLAQPARADGEPEIRRTRTVEVVERARPATVAIHTTELVPQSFYGYEFPDLPPLSREGLGSGVIFHPDGFVVTNAHVIARASRVLVDMHSKDPGTGEEKTIALGARILAVDVPNDLALLKLEPRAEQPFQGPYPFLPLGTSNDLMLGETIIAVGNPYGLGFTVTTGVLSGMGRRLPAGGRGAPVFEDFLQIDAAINQGNSGGPLMDVTGRWIGVTTAILNRQRTGAEGIGFAIPSDRVRSLITRALKRRLLTDEWTGIEEDEGPGGRPAIRFVFPKGPAAGLDLKPGDVVATLNGTPVATLYEYRMVMAALPAGSRVSLGIIRDGRPLAAPVEVALVPVTTDDLSVRHLGMRTGEVDEALNRKTQIPFDAGVLIRELRPNGPGDRIRLKLGDLIVALGSYKIKNTDDLLMFLQYVQAGDVVKVKIRRVVSRAGDGRMLWEDKEGALVAE